MAEEPQVKKLKEEADFIRHVQRYRHLEEADPARFPEWKKAVYLFFILATLIGSVYLLISENSRKNLIQTAANALGLGSVLSDDRTFDLPPPPPKAATENVVIQRGGPVFTSDDEFEGILYSTPGMDPTIDSEDEDGKPTFVAPPRSEGSELAFNLLKTESKTIEALINGELEGYEFKEWSPVQNKPPTYFIDVLALRTSDQLETHLIWEVNVETEKIRPLSQAARDLER